ncbi:NADP-dependent oxidoreductase [Nocardioides insulae]|uniref:NADP-dependent oxidoreductase n=1 Tax=Nocardioides insulae TaxID=394734 RepID=UPI000400E881|nr:NADP-dependent oxidoreductase [Nocardioides insulae]
MTNNMMRAALVRTPGAADSIEITAVERPRPRAGEVLVKVVAAAVNRIDLSTRNGNLAAAGLLAPAPHHGLGWDVAGEVVELGAGVERFAVGEGVIGLRDVLGDGGTHADFVVLREGSLAPTPRDVSAEHAATLPLAGLTAWHAFLSTRVRAGDSLLLTGAAGGVGSLLVQLAAMHGVEVVATADPGDEARLRDWGARHVLDRSTPLAPAVREILPRGVDAVVDCAVLGVAAHETLRAGGRFVALVAPFAPPPLRGTSVSVQEVWADGGSLHLLSALAEAGRLELRVADVHSLNDLALAHARLEQGGVRGRLVVTP